MKINFPAKTRVIVGVSGGIAAYKSVLFVRQLQKLDVEVRVTMTDTAKRFIGRDTFKYLTQHQVPISPFEENDYSSYKTSHVQWSRWGSLYIIAPCTANTLAKIAHGISDNMVTMLALNSHTIPIVICPTMDINMYHSPSVKQNISKVKEYGIKVIEPKEGYLASRLEGKGRLPEPEELIVHCQRILKQVNQPQTIENKIWEGRSVLVTTGATLEFIDPIRYISNPSSGKMGLAMAQAAYELGANVTTIHGSIQVEINQHLNPIRIETSQQLYEKVKDQSNSDIIIMTAAVADFKPVQKYNSKIKKHPKNGFQLSLQPTIDILAWLGKNKKSQQTLIGFAMETEDMENHAKKKLIQKNCDWILANNITQPNIYFGSDYNRIVAFGKNNTSQDFIGLKQEIAKKILSWITSHK